MKVQLMTKDRKLVARYQIPEFHPGPEILAWGNRMFTRSDEQFIDTTDAPKERIYNYVEGMAYFIFDSSKKWEPADDHDQN